MKRPVDVGEGFVVVTEAAWLEATRRSGRRVCCVVCKQSVNSVEPVCRDCAIAAGIVCIGVANV